MMYCLPNININNIRSYEIDRLLDTLHPIHHEKNLLYRQSILLHSLQKMPSIPPRIASNQYRVDFPSSFHRFRLIRPFYPNSVIIVLLQLSHHHQQQQQSPFLQEGFHLFPRILNKNDCLLHRHPSPIHPSNHPLSNHGQ